MKSILFIADYAAATKNAARHLRFNIIVGQTQPTGVTPRQLAVIGGEDEGTPEPAKGMPEALRSALEQDKGTVRVPLEVLDIADYVERRLAEMMLDLIRGFRGLHFLEPW